MVDTSFSTDEMNHIFSSKGLSFSDLVILSGAHTIGKSHCSSFSERFQQDKEENLEPIAAEMDKDYANELLKICPANADGNTTVNNDPVTADVFDNQYYRNLMNGKGLFRSDSVLFSDERSRAMVEGFSAAQSGFFAKWSESFVKLAGVGVKTNELGEIRESCMKTNGIISHEDKFLGLPSHVNGLS